MLNPSVAGHATTLMRLGGYYFLPHEPETGSGLHISSSGPNFAQTMCFTVFKYFWAVTLLLTTCLALSSGESAARGAAALQDYSYRPPSSGGTGKIYLGREIARVMRPQGAAWLERPDRETEEQPDSLVSILPLEPDDVVADIGAGSGYFTFRISPRIPGGQLLAVDIQPEMLRIIKQKKQEYGAANVVPILGTVKDPNLPEAGVDLVLMVDTYHEFLYPREMMDAIMKSLKPDGLVVLVEYRSEDPSVRKSPLHKMTEAQVRLEMGVVGLQWIVTYGILPQQHVIVFTKQ